MADILSPLEREIEKLVAEGVLAPTVVPGETPQTAGLRLALTQNKMRYEIAAASLSLREEDQS